MTELTTGQKIDNPLFNFTIFHIESRANDTALVQTPIQFNDNLICSVVINDLKFPNVSCDDRIGIVANANGATNERDCMHVRNDDRLPQPHNDTLRECDRPCCLSTL